MPFSTYKDFQDCLKKNKGKDDPEAYCAELKRKTEKVVDWNYHLSFVKLAGTEEDVMYIAGEASNPDEDEDGELMDMESLKGAYSSYMANPVIKFMHDKAPQWRGAIGKVIEKYTDSDGTADCNDNCPNDSIKTEPGICGCGVVDNDSDDDGTPDCNDDFPDDGT